MFEILPYAGIAQIRFKGSDLHPLSRTAPLVFISFYYINGLKYIHMLSVCQEFVFLVSDMMDKYRQVFCLDIRPHLLYTEFV